MCLKYPASAYYACFELCTPMVNGCANCALFDAVPNVLGGLTAVVEGNRFVHAVSNR